MNPFFKQLLASNQNHADTFEERFEHLQESQNPDAVTICCSDSRVLQDHMWGNDQPGTVFTCSNIGNRVFQETGERIVISGDVLYPLIHTGTKTVIVVGHTGCGAVTATYRSVIEEIEEPIGIKFCIDLLKPSIENGVSELPAGITEEESINHLVEWNVDRQVDKLLSSNSVPDGVDVVGTVYDFQDVYSEERGLIHVINVNGTRDVSSLRDQYPEISDRIQRLWDI